MVFHFLVVIINILYTKFSLINDFSIKCILKCRCMTITFKHYMYQVKSYKNLFQERTVHSKLIIDGKTHP